MEQNLWLTEDLCCIEISCHLKSKTEAEDLSFNIWVFEPILPQSAFGWDQNCDYMDSSQSGLSHRHTAFLLHSSLANPTRQNIYLVWVIFCPHASSQCLAGKIDFHPHHSCFAEWIMLSSRIFHYFVTLDLQNSYSLLQKNINMFDVNQTFCLFSAPLKPSREPEEIYFSLSLSHKRW